MILFNKCKTRVLKTLDRDKGSLRRLFIVFADEYVKILVNWACNQLIAFQLVWLDYIFHVSVLFADLLLKSRPVVSITDKQNHVNYWLLLSPSKPITCTCIYIYSLCIQITVRGWSLLLTVQNRFSAIPTLKLSFWQIIVFQNMNCTLINGNYSPSHFTHENWGKTFSRLQYW